MKSSRQTWLNLSNKVWKQREKEMRKGSPVSIIFSFCGFPRGGLLEDFGVLKCFPEHLVRLSGKQQWTELYLLLLGICGMKGSYASFAGKMQTWCLELRTDCVGWLSGKGREFFFPKRINDCVHCASWTVLVKNFSFPYWIISLKLSWFGSFLKLITSYIFEVPFSLW